MLTEEGSGRTNAGSHHPKPHHHTTVGLEQLIHTEHVDAGGQIHQNKKASAGASYKNDTKSAKTLPRAESKQSSGFK